MTQLFDFLGTIDFDDDKQLKENFNQLVVSVFDHFLTEEEYSIQSVMCYSDAVDDESKEAEYKIFEEKFVKFYTSLYEIYGEEITYLLDENEKKASSWDEYIKIILNSIKEMPLCGLILNNLGIYILAGYDLTHVIYVQKGNEKIIPEIEKLVHSSGLFLIQPKE